MNDTDAIIGILQTRPGSVAGAGAINWADLRCSEAAIVRAWDGSAETERLQVTIEEAPPDNFRFSQAIQTELTAKGWELVDVVL